MHIVEVIVGHSSTRLPPGRPDGHTHKWTLFVKPANREYEDFLDTKLIQKVKFKIHETFEQPERLVKKPPFKITESGFASFGAVVTIYLNLPNEKPRSIPYELTLFTGDHDVQNEVQKLAIRSEDVPQAYLEQIRRYSKSKKRKASMISSSNDEKSPQDNHRKSQKMTPSEDEKMEKKVKKRDMEFDEQYEKKKDKKEKKEKEVKEPKEKVKTPDELTKKLNECEDPYVIYKASEFLLSLPTTTLSSTTFNLSYDLTKCDTEALLEIGRILKLKKTKK
ncbi:hypothetical protein GCK72_001494 [Caenorhabditis remanei]|uniref:YEATS domain-containing protein n=2 Tax=Caenorhabditis remanei TaxID=31234 RepID=E3N1P2_CAERE|nr:hypothetical protein GCK72_001494 [Caenorhabditis remanei]EFO83772.1 hypothetical protein CRE_14209 [Caenorhabditis remanei]KAF1769677.1 hypothetical protein GCK72_001494 [Caenorhabditis remanei]